MYTYVCVCVCARLYIDTIYRHELYLVTNKSMKQTIPRINKNNVWLCISNSL